MKGVPVRNQNTSQAASSSRSVKTDEKKQNGTRNKPFEREQIELADAQFQRAFAILGLVSEDNNLVCPLCHTSKRGKVQIKVSSKTEKPYWTCHKCSDPGPSAEPQLRPWGTSAIDLLKHYGERSFPEAVEELLGLRESSKTAKLPVLSLNDIGESFQAVVDVEVYDFIADWGSSDLAASYYARWHISRAAVEEVGASVIEDAKALQDELVKKFGWPRLFDAGVVILDKHQRNFFLFSDDYPVIEPHRAPSGHVVGLQFRPSGERLEKVYAHKKWKNTWSGHIDPETGEELEASEAWRRAYVKDPSIGPKHGYITSFLSLRGGTPDHLVGGGLPRLIQLPAGSRVFIFEGIKDLMAARTLDVEAYAIAGTGAMPSDRVVELLKRFKVLVALDGDQAGVEARQNVVTYLTEKGVDASAFDKMREGMDVTDSLVEATAHAGCTCETCTLWVEEHPYDPDTCLCKTCRDARN